uniref:Uncharacterized protein n=1 Tax=Solanum tuberosum TaxID=4113 RepID=M1D8T6_SOLTU
MSSLRLQGNSSEPNTPTTNQSATLGRVLTQVGVRDMHNRLVIEHDGYTFNPDDTVGIISQAIKDLYRDAFPTWGKMPSNLKRQIFLEYRTFREYHSEFEGLSSSYDDESMKKYLAMEQKIAELSSQVEDSRARERRRDIEYAGLKAQLDTLLSSGGIPPCSNDVTFPPRPSQPQPTRYLVYGQQ